MSDPDMTPAKALRMLVEIERRDRLRAERRARRAKMFKVWLNRITRPFRTGDDQ